MLHVVAIKEYVAGGPRLRWPVRLRRSQQRRKQSQHQLRRVLTVKYRISARRQPQFRLEFAVRAKPGLRDAVNEGVKSAMKWATQPPHLLRKWKSPECRRI